MSSEKPRPLHSSHATPKQRHKSGCKPNRNPNPPTHPKVSECCEIHTSSERSMVRSSLKLIKKQSQRSVQNKVDIDRFDLLYQFPSSS
ncbi:hypothetical protein HNY73_015641 [Argiope bruennichi]|uniref:Uncharacterized protein n=1 Tax=Argiope bruennichi TaxID=94029 RepID=A0A8T0ET99_ARGBR|nr:hypothetical protein HNY73_015641 [Argiope bruennichi]